jgi:CRP-like cAMP-binding protein
MVHQHNDLLNRLDPVTLAAMMPHLSVVPLAHGQVIADTHQPIGTVYFPHSGIISCVVTLSDGRDIETGMIGNDGAFGVGQALDGKVSLNHVVIQVPGSASAIESTRLCDLAQQIPALRKVLVAYEQFFLAQVQQVGACNAVHSIHHRTCKWLLRMHCLVGKDLPLTQEFLAQMMGVRRTSVTQVAKGLQKLGMITYRRGRIRINDLDLVRQHACECDHAIRSHHQRLFGPGEPSPPVIQTNAA